MTSPKSKPLAARHSDLLPGHLIEGQPTLLVGPTKTLRSTICIDLAVALATGSKFLNEVQAPRPTRVMFLSHHCEEGLTASIFRKILDAHHGRGSDEAKELLGENIVYGEMQPWAGSPWQLTKHLESINDFRPEVVIVDSLLGCLDMRDMSLAAEIRSDLASLSGVLIEQGVTPVFVHSVVWRTGRKLTASDLYDPVCGFFRNTIALSRRVSYGYESNQIHKLWAEGSLSNGREFSYSLDVKMRLGDEYSVACRPA